MSKYLIRVGDALSQLLNVLVFLGDNPNESLSGRAYRQQYHWFWYRMRVGIDWIFAWVGQASHCKQAYLADLARATSTLGGHRTTPQSPNPER